VNDRPAEPTGTSQRHRPVVAVEAALTELHSRIDRVEREWDHPVEITAVTKAFEPAMIDVAVRAGCRVIGENYAQELQSKRSTIEALDERPRVEFIGHLQSNKVRQIADLVDRWCTVDRPSIAAEIAKRAPGSEVLIQVNATSEDAKNGCAPEHVAELRTRCSDLGLHPIGLLTVGPTGRPASDAEAGFRIVRALVDELELRVCSMGMSGDLEVAVACGSTNVRVGSALFGARPDPGTIDPVHHERDAPG